jgi:hypothetical protein
MVNDIASGGFIGFSDSAGIANSNRRQHTLLQDGNSLARSRRSTVSPQFASFEFERIATTGPGNESDKMPFSAGESSSGSARPVNWVSVFLQFTSSLKHTFTGAPLQNHPPTALCFPGSTGSRETLPHFRTPLKPVKIARLIPWTPFRMSR